MLGTVLKLTVVGLLLGFLVFIYQSAGTGKNPIREAGESVSSWQRNIASWWRTVGAKSDRIVERLPLPDAVRGIDEVYVWKDESGQTHMANSPPADVPNAERIQLGPIDNSVDPDDLPVPD